MEDVRRKGEEVEDVSIGLDGDWFLRTDTRHGTFPPHHSHQSSAKQEITMLQHAKQSTDVRT